MNLLKPCDNKEPHPSHSHRVHSGVLREDRAFAWCECDGVPGPVTYLHSDEVVALATALTNLDERISFMHDERVRGAKYLHDTANAFSLKNPDASRLPGVPALCCPSGQFVFLNMDDARGLLVFDAFCATHVAYPGAGIEVPGTFSGNDK